MAVKEPQKKANVTDKTASPPEKTEGMPLGEWN